VGSNSRRGRALPRPPASPVRERTRFLRRLDGRFERPHLSRALRMRRNRGILVLARGRHFEAAVVQPPFCCFGPWRSVRSSNYAEALVNLREPRRAPRWPVCAVVHQLDRECGGNSNQHRALLAPSTLSRNPSRGPGRFVCTQRSRPGRLFRIGGEAPHPGSRRVRPRRPGSTDTLIDSDAARLALRPA
jgi:hypothetical protein